MNINNIYDLEHFDEFNNIFTIYKKHVVTYKRNDNKISMCSKLRGFLIIKNLRI